MRYRIEPQIAVLDHGVAASGRAAQYGAHAGHHFVEIERLDDVVIGAGIEAGNPLPNFIARRENDDGRGAAALTHCAQDAEAVTLRQPEIEKHQVENRVPNAASALFPSATQSTA